MAKVFLIASKLLRYHALKQYRMANFHLFSIIAVHSSNKMYNYHHLTASCSQSSQLRTHQLTVGSQKMLWTIRGCTKIAGCNNRCCLYSLITQRGYWCSKPYRLVVNLIFGYNYSHTALRQRRGRTTWGCRADWFWNIINDNWSISTKWAIRTFYLAEKWRSHVEHQKGRQRN